MPIYRICVLDRLILINNFVAISAETLNFDNGWHNSQSPEVPECTASLVPPSSPQPHPVIGPDFHHSLT